MFSKQLKSVKFVTSKSFETHFYSFLDFSHLKSIFCEVPESILTITGNTWQFKTSLFWEQAFIFASWFDPIFDFNQSIYFGGNTLTIMFNQFQLFSFFLDHWFLLGSWCSLAHREPKWLRNLFPGANFVDCYLGLFWGHIDMSSLIKWGPWFMAKMAFKKYSLFNNARKGTIGKTTPKVQLQSFLTIIVIL